MYGLIVFGDSITFGFGDPEHGWCGRLQKRFESMDEYNCCFNLGICGDTTNDLLARIDVEANARARYALEDDHHAIIVAIGINDSRLNGETPQTEPDEYEANLREILSIAKRHTERVLFVGPTPVDESLAADYEGTTFTNERVQTYSTIAHEVCVEHDFHSSTCSKRSHEPRMNTCSPTDSIRTRQVTNGCMRSSKRSSGSTTCSNTATRHVRSPLRANRRLRDRTSRAVYQR